MNNVKDFFEYILNAVKIFVIVQPWQSGIRVRSGKTIKVLEGGVYFKIPYFDSVYIQETRLRVIPLPMQTLTSKDLKTITLSSSLGYTVTSVEKLYKTLYHPETTIQSIAMSEVSEFVFKTSFDDLEALHIENSVIEKLNKEDYGLKFEYFKITSFAVAKTFRLIQDQNWVYEGLSMNEKK